MLIIFGGLPGTGKSTISCRLAQKLKAIYLRIDSIETALDTSSLHSNQAGNTGYLVAYNIARDNLKIGHIVVADSVNPVETSRESWKNVAIKENKGFLEIEIICSNTQEHKHRIKKRNTDSHDTTPLTTWKDVMHREYETWTSADLRLDTYKMSIDSCVENILEHLRMNSLSKG